MDLLDSSYFFTKSKSNTSKYELCTYIVYTESPAVQLPDLQAIPILITQLVAFLFLTYSFHLRVCKDTIKTNDYTNIFFLYFLYSY